MSVNLYVSIAPSHIFISAQIQIVNSNSKLYVVYTLYIIRDTAVCVCMLRDGRLVWSDFVAVGRHGFSCGEMSAKYSTYYV